MPLTKRTVYLSSTYEDLKEHRAAVFKALRKGGYDVIAMEESVATDKRPVDECLADVAQADIYVGVFGFRYGYVPQEEHRNPQHRSITELEFQQAKVSQKPCLVFVAKPNAGFPLEYVDAYTGAGEQGKAIERLRQLLLAEHMASQFSTPSELATEVLAAVNTQDKKLSGVIGTQPKLGNESQPPVTWDAGLLGSPYPGLLHFTRTYAPVFFGREVETQEI